MPVRPLWAVSGHSSALAVDSLFSWVIRQTSTRDLDFCPKGLNKSAQGQSRASRDATLGKNAHKPILPCKGYIKSAILTPVRRLRHSRGNPFLCNFQAKKL